ncbi:MAG: 50S ribosomal protein L17 [Spirochaetota bacterium]
MKHRVGFNRLGRKPAHRKALHRNMVTSLFKYERIQTTKAKAREIRRTAEKMITRAKVDSVHNRRMVARDIKDKAILAKLFVEIGPRFKSRPGGYTRMLKVGPRAGDASEMVLLELVEEETQESPKSKKKAGSEAKPAPKKKAKAKAEPEAKEPEAKETEPQAAEEAAQEAATDEEKKDAE